MKPRFVMLTLLAASVVVYSQDQAKPPPKRRAPAAAEPIPVKRGDIRHSIALKGTFVPAQAAEIKLEMQGYRGPLKILDVKPHGSVLNEGDIVLRLDTRDYEKQLITDRMALDSAELAWRQSRETRRVTDAANRKRVEAAQRSYDRAKAQLDGFLKHEKQQKVESERLSLQAQRNRLEDQNDELVQLEKMYSEDELVDATEEIVLKRARRNFARSKASFELSERRRLYRKKFYEGWREEDLRLGVEAKRVSLENTIRSVEMGNAKTRLAVAKQEYSLGRQRRKFKDLENDKGRFVVRAPRAGLLLHGKPEGPWGEQKAGGTLRNRVVFTSVADPRLLKVNTSVMERDIFKVANNMAVEAVPTADEERKRMGRLRVAYLPVKGVFKAQVEFEGVNRTLRPGMTCKLEAILAEARDVVLVPSSVVKQEDGRSYVTLKGGAKRFVTTGLDDGRNIEIKDGLKVGDFVLP